PPAGERIPRRPDESQPARCRAGRRTQRSNRRNEMKAIAMAIFACGLIGCMADDPASTARTEPATDQVTPDDELPLDMPADRAAQSSLSADDLGNAPNTLDVAAANCVFIQWCNEPGANGTIC